MIVCQNFLILLWKSEPLSEVDDEEESNVEVSPFPSFKIESDVMFAVVDGVPAEDELENSRCWTEAEFGFDAG